jgi:hypothetical protein
VSHGLGKHVEEVEEDERPRALIWKWAGELAYIVASTLVKLVVGIFLFRMCIPGSWQRRTLWILLVLIGVYNIFYVFVAAFQCVPAQYFWYRYMTNPPVAGSCSNKTLATVPTYIAIILGVVGDWTLALLPISLVRKAKLDMRTKISVVCILALGSL